MTLSIHSPDELIAALPHLLGFRPEESLVFVPLSSDLPVARVDPPTTPEDRELVWQGVREGFTRYASPAPASPWSARPRTGADVVSQEFAAFASRTGSAYGVATVQRTPGAAPMPRSRVTSVVPRSSARAT